MKNIFLLLLLSVSVSVFGQNDELNKLDSLQIAQADSLLTENGEETNDLISKLDSIKIIDSLALLKLTAEFDLIKATDEAQKTLIQARMDSLKAVQNQRKNKAKSQIDSLRAFTTGVPVIFNNDTLFLIYNKLGPSTPLERSQNIVTKMLTVAKSDDYSPDKLSLVVIGETADIVYDKFIIMSVVEKDAFWLDLQPNEAAEFYKSKILAGIQRYQDESGPVVMLQKAGLVLLIIFILYLLVRYLNKGFTWLNKKLVEMGGVYIKPIKFKNYEFLSVARTTKLIAGVLKLLKWIVIAFITYLSLPVMFSIFPSTKEISSKLIGYVTTPLKKFLGDLVDYLPELVTIIIIILITRYIIRGLKFLTAEVEKGNLNIPGFFPDFAKPTLSLIKFVVYAFSFVIIFPYLPGSSSPAFQGVGVFLGLLVSLGSSSAIGNIIAGLVITYMRAFKKGDRVKIGDTTGDVIEKTMLVTRVKTIKNEEVTIPNLAILTGQTINYSNAVEGTGLILHTTITIGYDVAWPLVHELMLNAADAVDFIEKDPKPFILQTSLDDFYVSYELNVYTKNPGKGALIKSEIHKNIQEQFNKAQVEILSPHYRAERDGSDITIPK